MSPSRVLRAPGTSSYHLVPKHLWAPWPRLAQSHLLPEACSPNGTDNRQQRQRRTERPPPEPSDILKRFHQGRHFNFFLEGPKIFKFFNATGLLKNWKKQQFICSNLTLFIFPFFLFLLFFSFFFFFFLFSFFFLFFFFLGGGGRRPPSPPQMTPLDFTLYMTSNDAIL